LFASQEFNQGRRSSGTVWEGSKTLRAMQICKKQKNRYQVAYAFFCSETMLNSKIIPEIIENHSEILGARIAASCNKFVSIRSWQTMKLPLILS